MIVVTVVWAANFVAPIFVKGYTPAPELNVAFMAILGILTATANTRKPPPSGDGDAGSKESSTA